MDSFLGFSLNIKGLKNRSGLFGPELFRVGDILKSKFKAERESSVFSIKFESK